MAFLLAVMGGAAAVELVKRISGREEPVQDENEVLRGQHELQRLLQVHARAAWAAELLTQLSVRHCSRAACVTVARYVPVDLHAQTELVLRLTACARQSCAKPGGSLLAVAASQLPAVQD